MESILSKFLAAGLLPIGEDDEKLNLLEAAAEELAREFRERPLMTYRFALVGLDDRVAISDPAIQRTEQIVREKWVTITNKVGAGPVQIYRAVILRALQLEATLKPTIRYAICLLAHNEPKLHTSGAERETITLMLDQFEAENLIEIRDVWANPIGITFQKLSAKVRKASQSKDELIAGMARAVGPTDKDGKPLANSNPHTPDVGQNWSNEFSSRASEVIYATIQNSLKGTFEDVQESLRTSMEELTKGIKSMAIREAKSELLWIKSSLYSPSARTGYRSLSDVDLLLHSVLDISRAVFPAAPPSVEFFLRDLVMELSVKKMKLAKVLSLIGPKLSALPEAQWMDDSLPASGRRSWLDVAVRPNNEASTEQQTGVVATYEDSLDELAVKFYRELQIRKLLSAA